MTAFPSTWGGRAAEVLQGVILEHPATSLRQTVSEVVTIPFTPLIQGEQVRVARALRANGILDLTSEGNLLTRQKYPMLPSRLENAIASLPELTYKVEIHWNILRKHPTIYCVSPEINRISRPDNPHLYINCHPAGINAQGLCVYPPHYGLLSDPKHEAPHTLLLWVAAYLARDAIQHQTGIWLGAEASHNQRDILKNHKHSECWCGSGVPMMSCCGPKAYTALANRHQRFTNRRSL